MYIVFYFKKLYIYAIMAIIMKRINKFLFSIIILFSLSLTSGCGDLITDTGDYISANFGTPEKIESVSTEKYFYSKLDDTEKAVYDEMLKAFMNHDEKATIENISDDDLENVFYAVLADYGGIFWVNGYSYRRYEKENSNIILFPTYVYSKSEEDVYQKQIDDVVNAFLATVPADASDFVKSKMVYEYLITNVSYDLNSTDNQNIISVFLNGASVCQGIADAANYLFTEMNIPSAIIRGTANGQSHAWNIVMLDGQWYFFDATWGNSEYLDPELGNGVRYINYAYLNTTSEEMASTHVVDMMVDIPECTATADNYYVAEGLYFTSFDKNAMGNVFKNAKDQGMNSASVKCATADIYNYTKQYFLTDFGIANYIPGIKKIKYNERPDILVITIYF